MFGPYDGGTGSDASPDAAPDAGADISSNPTTDAAADAAPDGQSDGSSRLLLLHRRLRCLHGAVDGPGLLERKR